MLRTSGDPTAALMLVVVGDGDTTGLELTTAAGRMVWKVLGAAGLNQDDVYVVALDSEMTGESLDAARAVFAASGARVIAPIGGDALYAVTGLGPVTDWRGYLISRTECEDVRAKVEVPDSYKSSKRCPCHKANETAGHEPCKGTGWTYRKGDLRMASLWLLRAPLATNPRIEWIIPTLSPADVHKSQLSMLPIFATDLERAVRATQGRLCIPVDTWVDGPPPGTSKVIAVDIETDIWSTKSINRIGIANESGTWSTDDIESTRAALTAADTVIVHNAAFDFPRIEQTLKVDMLSKTPWDTMLAAYMLHPDGRKGLNWTISAHLDTQRHKHLSGSQPALYNALDVRRTLQLARAMTPKLRATGQLQFFEQGMMVALPTLIRMTQRGILIDHKFRSQQYSELSVKIDNMITGSFVKYKDYPALRQPLKIARHFKLRNSNEETLLRARAKMEPLDQEYVDMVLEYRAAAKALKTYFSDDSPRVHPSYLPGARDDDAGTKGIAYSGRPTASNPNIQNQPQYARGLFIPEPGNKFASLDWSQIEPRISAALSGDDVLAADLEGDVYSAVAQAAGCDRSTAKTVFLLSAYLGSPMTLQNKLMLKGVVLKLADCKALQASLFARYHRWARWRQGIITKATAERQLTNVFGKWAPFVRVHPAKAVNFFPQSCAACILWYCLPQVEAAIAPFGGTIVHTVHDEITIQAPEASLPAAIIAAKGAMQQEWPQIAPGFRVPTKVKIGWNWGTMHADDSLWELYDRRR